MKIFKIKKFLDLNLTVSNDKDYRTTVYDKLAYYISLLGDETNVREFIIITSLLSRVETCFTIPQARWGYN